jgi:hypothetical protein
MNRAFMLLCGSLLLLFCACETGLPRYAPAGGSYVKNGGGNRYSFTGGGNVTYEVPDGGFAIDTGFVGDAGEDTNF